MNRKTEGKKTLMILNFAMMVVLCIFWVVLFVITQNVTPEDASVDPAGSTMIYFVLGFMALPVSMLALMMPLIMGFWKANPTQHQSLLDKLLFNFDDNKLIEKMIPLTIMRFAFSEAVALFGFVIAFLSKNIKLYAPFFLLSLVLMFLVGPFFHLLRKKSNSDVMDYTNIS